MQLRNRLWLDKQDTDARGRWAYLMMINGEKRWRSPLAMEKEREGDGWDTLLEQLIRGLNVETLDHLISFSLTTVP